MLLSLWSSDTVTLSHLASLIAPNIGIVCRHQPYFSVGQHPNLFSTSWALLNPISLGTKQSWSGLTQFLNSLASRMRTHHPGSANQTHASWTLNAKIHQQLWSSAFPTFMTLRITLKSHWNADGQGQPRSFWFCRSEVGYDNLHCDTSQVVLKLLTPGPHFESH